MYGFVQYAPTKVIFGRGAEDKLSDELKARECKSVLLIYGGGSAVRSGLITRVKWILERCGVKQTELAGVKPNPRLSLVREGVELCRREGADIILAVGGGSVIDTAKAIGMAVAENCDPWDFYCGKRVPEKTLPVGVVLTISAAGSEMSNSSVITNDRTTVKRGCNADVSRPAFAIMNPELTLSVPAFQTACGCADIFMHTAERYLTGGETMRFTDSLAEALMTSVIKSSAQVMKNPSDYSARADLMWAGSVSHNGLTGCGGDGGDWSTHALGHELSARYDAPHGAALTAVWGSWARFVYKNCLNRFHSFAVQVMGVRPNGTREELALKGIEATEEWFARLGLPTSLKELGIEPTDEELKELADSCAENAGGCKGSCVKLYAEDMLAIYRAAK